jgi:uncharacterized membrane protein YcaP (DUF421 family)
MSAFHQLGSLFHDTFGGDFPDEPLKIHQVMARAVVVYLAGIAIIRLGKSRSIGRITPLDVILGFVLGSLLSRGITGHASLSGTAASSAALVATHWLLTRLACNWHWLGDLVKGRAHIIVEDGKPIFDSMRRHHISIHDLEEALRIKGIDDIQRVRVAYKERNGEVSFLMRKEPLRILDVAVESGVQTLRIKLE